MAISTCKKTGINITNVFPEGATWRGLYDKVFYTYEFLKQCDSEYVLFLDGYDTVVLTSPQELVNRFQAAGCDILYSGEKTMYPPAIEASRIEGGGIFPYINSGCFMGRRESLLLFHELLIEKLSDSEFMASYIAQACQNDQGLVRLLAGNFNEANIRVDYSSLLFLTVFGAEGLYVSDNKEFR